jgi:AraC-like DNA-binding protein
MSSLPDIRLDGVTYGVARFDGPWALSIPATQNSYFCMVRRGDAWFEPSIGHPRQVRVAEGAVITVPRGQAHVWRSRPEVDPPHSAAFYPLVLPTPDSPPHDCMSELFIGIAPLDAGPPITHLTNALPPYLHIRETEREMLAHLNAVIRLIEYEISHEDSLIDAQSVLRRLSEVIAIDCARFALTSTERARPSWLAGMTDPLITRALSQLHAHPEHPWDVESLARQLGLGRSAFAQRFKSVVGEGPMHYLMKIRMQQAAAEIRCGGRSLHEIALALGYQSEAAFSRAFSHHMGVSPGRFRSAASATETESDPGQDGNGSHAMKLYEKFARGVRVTP